MTDNPGSGAAALAASTGQPGAAGAGGTTPAGAGGAGAGTAGTPPQYAPLPEWAKADGVDPALGDVVKAKGWTHPSQVLDSYRNLEKLVGADKAGRALVLPKDANDAEGYAKVYDALGRPKTPEEYKLPVPDGDNGDFAKSMAPHLHKLGLSQAQAEGLATVWNDHLKAVTEAEDANRIAKAQADMNDLRREWGNGYDAKMEEARRFTRTFGVSTEQTSAIESALGTGEFLRLFAKIGASLGEDGGIPRDGKGGFGLTPSEAQAEIAKRHGDPAFKSRYLSGDKSAIEEMSRLHQAAAAGG